MDFATPIVLGMMAAASFEVLRKSKNYVWKFIALVFGLLCLVGLAHQVVFWITLVVTSVAYVAFKVYKARQKRKKKEAEAEEILRRHGYLPPNHR